MAAGNTHSRSSDRFWVFWILALGVFIYGHSLHNGFIWDDNEYISQNPLIHSLAGLLKFWDMSPGASPFPLTLTTFWLQHKLWGFHPWGYHTFSLTLHLLNALLLFGLLRRFAPALAGITALLFTVHPIQVESVAWIAEQKNLLCLFFFLLAFHAFLDFDSNRKKTAYLKMIFFFTAALLSKCIAACFAAVPILYAWWKQGSVSRRDLFLTLPLLILGALSALLPTQNESIDATATSMLFAERFLLAGKAFLFYIKQTLFPWQFLTLYPKWDIHLTHAENWLFPLGVIVLYTVLYRARRHIGRGPFALLCFYGISIFPALGFLNLALHQATYVTDHFSYLSVPPILLLCCAAARALFVTAPAPRSLHLSPLFKKITVGIIVVYLSLLSFCLTLNYGNPFILWNRLLQQAPGSSAAYNHLGSFMLENPGVFKTEQTIPLFQKAIDLDPGCTGAYVNLGLAYERTQAYDKAVRAYSQALQQASPHSKSVLYYYIGNASLLGHELDKASDYFHKALESYALLSRGYQKRRTGDVLQKEWIYGGLGNIHLRKKEYLKAAEAYRKAILLDPQNASNYQGWGTAVWNLGDAQGTLRAYQKAHELDPQNKSLKEDLGKIRKIMASLEKKELPSLLGVHQPLNVGLPFKNKMQDKASVPGERSGEG